MRASLAAAAVAVVVSVPLLDWAAVAVVDGTPPSVRSVVALPAAGVSASV
jgi:hypothetical protein